MLWFGFRFYTSNKGKLTRWFHLKCPFILRTDREFIFFQACNHDTRKWYSRDKQLGSSSFHTTKPLLYYVPKSPDDWDNIKTAVESFAEWQGGIWPHSALCQRQCLFSLRWKTQMTLHQLWQRPSDTPPSSVLSLVPTAFLPDETLEAT